MAGKLQEAIHHANSEVVGSKRIHTFQGGFFGMSPFKVMYTAHCFSHMDTSKAPLEATNELLRRGFVPVEAYTTE